MFGVGAQVLVALRMVNLVLRLKPAGADVGLFSVDEKKLKLLPKMCLESRLAAVGVNLFAALSQYSKSKHALPAIAALPALTASEPACAWFEENLPLHVGSRFKCVAQLLCVKMHDERISTPQPSSVETSVKSAMISLLKNQKDFEVMSWRSRSLRVPRRFAMRRRP